RGHMHWITVSRAVCRAGNIQSQHRYCHETASDDDSSVVDALRTPTRHVRVRKQLQAGKFLRALAGFGGLYRERYVSTGVQAADDIGASVDAVHRVIAEIGGWLEKVGLVPIGPHSLEVVSTLCLADENARIVDAI